MVNEFLSTIWAPGDVREIRAFDSRGMVTFGYFDSPDRAAKAVESLSGTHTVYITLNPVKQALLARCKNRLTRANKRTATTSDNDIEELRYLLIDCDPDRPSGISATDSEKDRAKEIARQVVKELGNPLLVGDSGNGYHLIYRHNAKDKEQLKAFLQDLAVKYNGDIKIDTSVFNPARITKVLGTWARKGDNTKERPHRKSRLIKVYSDNVVLDVPLVDVKPSYSGQSYPGGNGRIDVKTLLGDRIKCVKDEGWRTIYVLNECIFDPSHKGRDASIIQGVSGKTCYYCFHDSCRRRTWHDVKRVLGIDSTPYSTTRTDVHEVEEVKVDNILDTNPDLPIFPVDVFPDAIKEYCIEVAKSIPCPIDYVGIATLSALSVIIGKSEIEIKEDWIERPNLYCGIVAPSGAGKTPAINAIMEASIYRIESEYVALNKQASDEYERRSALYDVEVQKWKQEAKACEQYVPDMPEKPETPQRKEIFTTDTTTEALAEMMCNNPGGILLIRDEFSAWVKSLDQYRSGDKGTDREFFLSCWSGAPCKINRKTKPPIMIPKPRISVLGGIVPENLKLLTGKTDGFFERIFCIHPKPVPRKFEANSISFLVKTGAEKAFDSVRVERHVKLDDRARTMFGCFYEIEYAGEYESYTPKLITMLARFALILSCAWQRDICTSDIMAKAVELAEYAKSHIETTNKIARTSKTMVETNAIIEWAKRKNRKAIKVRDLCRAGLPGCTSARATREKIQEIVDLGLGRWDGRILELFIKFG